MGRTNGSPVWRLEIDGVKLYTKLNSSEAQCNICVDPITNAPKKIKLTNGNTSVLVKHIPRHPEYKNEWKNLQRQEEGQKVENQQDILDSFLVSSAPFLPVQMAPKQNKIQLIELVRENPFLFDRLNEDNRNKGKLDAKWSEIAELCGYDDGEDARSTWTNVVKARNRWKIAAANGSDAKPYLYEEHLRFLDNYYPYKQLSSSGQAIASPSSSTTYNQELMNLLSLNGNNFGMEEDGIEETDETIEPEQKRPKLISLSQENGTPKNNSPIKLEETMGEAFSRTVAISLNQIKSKKTQMQAQLEIMQILLKYSED